jgi:phosphoglycolate phosphatase
VATLYFRSDFRSNCRSNCRGEHDYRLDGIRAVLFDKDGTLADVETYLRALAIARSRCVASQVPGLEKPLCAAFGLSLQTGELDPAGLMAVGSRQDNCIAAAAYVAATGVGWIAALELVEQAFQQAQATLPPKVGQTPPLEGAIALLHRLAAQGIKTAIVSADTQAEVTAFIEHYELPHIAWHCGTAPGRLPKTHPDFLRFACDAISGTGIITALTPAEIVVIGDSAADWRLAQQGAAGFVGMTGGWRQWQKSPGALFQLSYRGHDIQTVARLSDIAIAKPFA